MSPKNKNNVMLDEIDKKIINLLNNDGRMSYREISRKLNISVGTVHNRIKKLMDKGVIKKFMPVIDHSKLGYDLTVIIGIKAKSGFLEDLKSYSSNKNILCIYDVTGEFDVVIIARFKNTSELDNFIKNLLKEPKVVRTYTQIVLNVVKENMNSCEILEGNS